MNYLNKKTVRCEDEFLENKNQYNFKGTFTNILDFI